VFSDDDKQGGDFVGLPMSSVEGKKIRAATYAKNVPTESVRKLEEVDMEEAFSIGNEAPVVHSLTDGEAAEVVLNQADCENMIMKMMLFTLQKKCQ
jgi:hypothetical protein